MLKTPSPLTSRFRTSSPPPRALSPEISKSPQLELEKAAVQKDETNFGWAKVGAGLGLAALALTGCTDPVPPAADPGAFELENPELVVMSDSIQRIDLARETDEVCTGIGEDETCTTVDVDYHDIGIHFGHGVVQDLNGNLFAAPQLVAPGAPGLAVSNPSRVVADGPLGSGGTLVQTEHGRYTTDGSLFGYRQTITVEGDQALVEGTGLFGGKYEKMKVAVADGRASVSEGRYVAQYVQSQGDHLLVQTRYGGEIAEIRHDTSAHRYEVRRPALFGDYNITMTYGPNRATRSSDSWGSGERTVTRTTNEKGNTVFEKRDNSWRGTSTEKTDDGWTHHYRSLFGSRVDYDVDGGHLLP